MDQVLKTRAITALVFSAIVLSMLAAGKWGILLLLVIVFAGGSYEYIKISGGSTRNALMGLGMSTLLFIGLLLFPPINAVKEVILGCTLLTYVWLLSTLFTRQWLPLEKWHPFAPVIYPGMALVLPLVWQSDLVWTSNFWLFTVLLIWVSDTGAYLVGRKLGKTKLFERISPKKTWEGTIGAGLFTVGAGLGIYLLSESFSMQFWLIASIIIWIFGSLGDLFESSLKRHFGVKDSGSFMPGHGGFLDRFDSLIVAIPFLILLLKVFKYIV